MRTGGDEQRDLCAMKEWAEAQPPAFREGAMDMYRVKATAFKALATIMPKRNRRAERVDPTDEEDNDVSEPDRDDPPPLRKRGKKLRTRKVVTPLKKA